MSIKIPVDFEAKVKSASQSSGGGYPYQISAQDLMKNFVFATILIDDKYVESVTGLNGHEARKLKIFPPIPASGTYVLGAVNGSLTWIATEEC
jgi:hypothetical protein